MAGSLIDGKGRLNVENYNEKVRKQRETFAKIDWAMAVLEKLPNFAEGTLDLITANSFSASFSPLEYIFNLIKSLGVDEETLRKWIVDILVFVLPTVEVGIKASLLSNIKSLLSCNSDPRIPLRLRKKVSDSVYTNVLTGINEDRGIDINIDVIDPQGILDLSPFTEPGLSYYFGCVSDELYDSAVKVIANGEEQKIGDGNSKTAQLVRADDFNAFLWYVIHKGNRQNPMKAKVVTDGGWQTLKVDGDETIYYITSSNSTFLDTIELLVKDGQSSNLIAGNTFYSEDNPNNIAICINTKFDSDGVPTGNTIVPISSDWYSCNWYVDKSNYYSSNIGIKKAKPRNYLKEKAICNVRYCQQVDYKGRVVPNTPNNLRFTILPKPYVLLPTANIERDDEGKFDRLKVQWRPIKLLFDANGRANQKGRFSLISETYDLQPTLRNKNTDGDYTTYDVYGIGAGGVHEKCGKLKVNIKTGYYVLEEVTNLQSMLVECYNGLTVYEFNYDYIMGMKLFDPKVMCQRLFDNVANSNLDIRFNLTLNKLKNKNKYPFLEGKQSIVEIVKTILEEDDDDELNDCFFSFSNEQYDEMLKKTEEIKYRQLPFNQGYNEGWTADFSEALAILNNFPEQGSQEEQKEVINKALTKACDALAERDSITIPSDSSTIKIDFLTNILQNLVASIVDSVLSPKVLMLFMVNKALIEPNDGEMFNIKDLIKILKNVVTSLIQKAKELIIQKLMDYIIEHLTPIVLQLQAKILSEQFAAYMAIIKLLLSWYNEGLIRATRLSSILSSMISKLKNKFGANYEDYGDITEIDLPTILDDVDYADIINNINNNKPIINDC